MMKIKKYQYNPLINIKYHLDQKHFRISDNLIILISEKRKFIDTVIEFVKNPQEN